MAWVRTWFSRLSKVGICEDGLPKTPKSSNTPSPQFNFVRHHIWQRSLSREGHLSDSKECPSHGETSCKSCISGKDQIGKTKINFTLKVVPIWHLDQSEFGQSSISKHWDEKVGPSCSLETEIQKRRKDKKTKRQKDKKTEKTEKTEIQKYRKDKKMKRQKDKQTKGRKYRTDKKTKKATKKDYKKKTKKAIHLTRRHRCVGHTA